MCFETTFEVINHAQSYQGIRGQTRGELGISGNLMYTESFRNGYKGKSDRTTDLIQPMYNSCTAFRLERTAKFAEAHSLPGGFKDSTQN